MSRLEKNSFIKTKKSINKKFFLLFFLGILSTQTAQATDYLFSKIASSLPPTCYFDHTQNNINYYHCKIITMNSLDKLNVDPNTRVNITVDENLTVGNNNIIGSSLATLDFNVLGKISIGNFAKINANTKSVGLTTIGRGNSIVGNITTDSGLIDIGNNNIIIGEIATNIAGVITVANDNIIIGSLNTLSGAINVGNNTLINGDVISSLAGVVNIGNNSRVTGKISTLAGAINLGTGDTVLTNISTGSGVISIGEDSIIYGSINNTDSLAGAVNLANKVIVNGIILSNAGAITLESGVQALLGLGSNAGAITVGSGSVIKGTVCTGVAGAITIQNNVNVTGNIITKLAGAITVGNGSNVNGGVRALGAGAITIDPGATVGKVLNSFECPLDTHVVVPINIKSRQWRQIFLNE